MTAAISTTRHHAPHLEARAVDDRPTPRLPESVYRRRRAVVGIVSAAAVAVTSVLAFDVLAGSGGVPAAAVSGQPAIERATIVARPGDTLWSIAERFRGEISVTAYVDALVNVNGGPSIAAGQRIVLP